MIRPNSLQRLQSQRESNFSGADLQALVREAALSALREQLKSGTIGNEKKGNEEEILVSRAHFRSTRASS